MGIEHQVAVPFLRHLDAIAHAGNLAGICTRASQGREGRVLDERIVHGRSNRRGSGRCVGCGRWGCGRGRWQGRRADLCHSIDEGDGQQDNEREQNQ